MSERPAFQATQYGFAAHIRDPDAHAAPDGIEDRRMAIYRDLFFNNVASLLGRTFPVLHRILGRDRWRVLMRDYFSHHESHTPLFLEMPREFLQYLEAERGKVDGDLPFMLELAHYEWVELALTIDERDPDLTDVDREGDLLEGRPVLSPLFWSLVYNFPVHQISPRYLPEAPPAEPTRLLVYRDLDDEVGFVEINIVTARLLELLADDSLVNGREALARIASEMNHPQPDTVIEGGLELLRDLRNRQVILGTTQPSSEPPSA
jgi:hypothetical protein